MTDQSHEPSLPSDSVQPRQAPTEFRPTRESKRIEALDVARGLALLGIFMVNIQFMTQPLGWYINGAGSDEGGLGKGVYYTTRVLFENKSYPLFSMLFGMGLVLMRERAIAAGRGFVTPYLRRIAMLLAMGIAHALLLWFGDVLAIYATVAVVVMWLAGLSPKWLLRISLSLVAIAALWTTGIAFVMMSLTGGAQPPMSGLDSVTFPEFIEALTSNKVQAGPVDPAWISGETDAIKNGPFLHAVAMRGITWLTMLVVWVILSASALHIAGMFLLGGFMMKAGIVGDTSGKWAKRLMLLGGLVGLPGAIAIVYLQTRAGQDTLGYNLGAAATQLVGPCVSLGYFGFAMWLAKNLGNAWPVRMVAAAGRMALTNYLLQSLLVAALAQHWGLAWFGDVPQSQMLWIVLGIYALQIALSPLWLARFSMGPLEWLWRWWTYLKPPRLLKRANSE